MSSQVSKSERIAEKVLRFLARLYIAIHRPRIVVVAGSVGKTSSKMMLAKLLASEKNVSYMDDSYNSGVGLYLSVFEKKVPTVPTLTKWLVLLLKVLGHFFKHYEILVLEYGIDKPGDMREMLDFAKPHVALLTAVTPEHMEFLNDIDTVGQEESLILTEAREFGIYNSVDIDSKYIADIKTTLFTYGSRGDDASYHIKSIDEKGSVVDFTIDGDVYSAKRSLIIADHMIRQMTGALLMASKLGVSKKSLEKTIGLLEPAISRMRPFEGINDSMVIDDTANFSPIAGVVALQTLKKIDANRRIAILGNMHELGDFIEEGYNQVGEEFKGIDVLVLVGDLSIAHFGSIAKKAGFVKDKSLYEFNLSTEAGIFVRDNLIRKGDVVLVKGPFGKYYLEEATKKLLASKQDYKNVTRQSDFWLIKKRKIFGKSLDK